MARVRLLLAGVSAALGIMAGAALTPAGAQVPAAARWQTVESTHFRVTFTTELEPLAAHTAAAAERARESLSTYLADAPQGYIDIVLADNVDYSNGWATPFPSNRIYLYAKPPIDGLDLNYLQDWLELVLVHELAHLFQLDATSRAGAFLRGVFGRVPASWPFFPAIGSPLWSLEGIAVAAESGVTPLGRLHGTWHDMVARTAALEGRIDDSDRLGSASPVWPGAQRVYIYGSLFLRDLQARYGAGAAGAIVRAGATALVPPMLWYDRVGQRAVGTGFRAAYDAWRERATSSYHVLADSLRATGLTASRVLVQQGGVAWYPRYSRDGRWLAYAHDDRRGAPVLRVVSATTGAEAWAVRRNGLAGAAWLDDRSLLSSQLEFRDRDHLFFELEQVSGDGARALGLAARLQDADVARDGRRALAVENGGGTNRLVLIDLHTGALVPITSFDPHVQWVLPRWSPAADLVAVSRWQAGGRYDVVVLDTLGQVVEEVTSGIGVNAAPAWTPDGRFIVFASDRTGISNLYAYDRRTRTLAQLSNTLTGAFYPDVAPDGRTIAFSSYHHDGFRIATMPFDSATFRPPSPATMPLLPTTPVSTPGPVDTAITPVRPYRPFRSLAPHYWAPVLLDATTGTFLGVGSSSSDLVERHAWSGWLAAASRGGRTAGAFGYDYRGLPPIAGTALQPALHLAAVRAWDRISDPPSPGEPYIDEREDLLNAGARLLHRRYRTAMSVGLSGEALRRRRLLMNAPGGRLLDPADRLLGARLTTTFSSARGYPFSIGAEHGISLQLSARQRWDQSARTVAVPGGGSRRFDDSEREWTAWSAAYLPLGRVAFANSVLALRGSALLRTGPGATTHGVGGTSGGGAPFGDLIDLGGAHFLPVRGFDTGTRRGTRAWTATAELRLPLAMLLASTHPVPLYLDRLSSALFVDAGNAGCPAAHLCDERRLGKALVSAGAEARLHAATFGLQTLIRLGAAAPLQGTSNREPRFYVRWGPGF